MELSNKNLTNIDLNLCLYCDKTFANNSDLENHVEREHKTILCKGKGSRKSERITKNHSSSENSPFPGCFHCNKKVFRTENLDTLFQHLLTSHKDVYFGCKCKIRTQDKAALAHHKKNCKLSIKPARGSEENLDDQKTAKKSQAVALNGDSRCDSLSETEDNISNSSAVNSKILPTNAIHKKSDRSKLKNVSKNASNNDKAKRIKSSSSSTISSSSSNKTGDDEYTIPLTRQKLKEPPRSGAIHNRPSSNKKTQKIVKTLVSPEAKAVAPISPIKVNRTKSSKIVNASSSVNLEPIESLLKSEIVNADFDEDFYRNITSNIRLNLSSYVDGKYNRLQNRAVFDKISVQTTSCATSDDRLSLPKHESEIHEATNFELSTPFPALLTAEQYGFGDSNPNKHKRQITKNSWKWKWDLIKKYKYVNEGGKIVKKVKQITTGLKDLSQLDMWTQLSMRSRYENLNSSTEIASDFDEGLHDSLSTRLVKTQNIEQLNHILDKCSVPEINIEQLQQTIIKVEQEEREDNYVNEIETEACNDAETTNPELFSMLNLVNANCTTPPNPMLSGEWARPRCYICVDCGLKFDLMKNLNDHKNSEHPYVVSAHYEIVGRENLEQHLYKNLFLPKKALQTSGFARSLSVNSDSKSNETNEASTSSDNSSKYFADQKEKECSKCLKMIKYSNDNDIYKHILDCIEDRVWMQAKRRSKYRKSRRKSRKTPRKLRLSVDQKKTSSSSSPLTKDSTEVENNNTFIEPNPKIDQPSLPEKFLKPSKNEPLATEKKEPKVQREQMNIKSFFRVSKSTPVPMTKLVVQMLEIPNERGSLKNSLRSSAAKVSTEKVAPTSEPLPNSTISKQEAESTPSNDKIKALPEMDPSEVNEKPLNGENIFPRDTSVPLTITTPEKITRDSPMNSPTSASLISPNSSVPKKKKKLNDCIAMLTCKIQAQLGVDFFHDTQPEPLKETTVDVPSIPQTSDKSDDNSAPKNEASSTEEKTSRKLSTSFQIASLISESSCKSSIIQDEVIDLSVKRKIEEPCEEPEVEVAKDLEVLENLTKQETVGSNVVLDQLKTESVLETKEEEIETEESAVDKVDVAADRLDLVNLQENDSAEADNKEKVVKELAEASVERVQDLVPSEVESLKISIPKEKIPNLREILDQYQMITVNNIKISESERRAFEEQKNRILKILNKTNSLTRKITNRKVTSTKALKRKAPIRRAATKTLRKRNNSKVKPETPKEKEESKNGSEESKIEEAIKTTNRIRCRRLSVVVDPIINLSSFQNKNRKMRLTNNSQQNGFYDLLNLAASEKFFTDTETSVKSKMEDSDVPTLPPTETSSPDEPAYEESEKTLQEPTRVMTKTRAAKSNAVRELAKLSGAVKDFESKNIEKPRVKEVKSVSSLITSAAVEDDPVEVLNLPSPIKKGRGKKQNGENIESSIVLLEKLENVTTESMKKPEKCNQTKGKTRRTAAKTTKKNSLPLEEIKVEQSLKPANIIETTEKSSDMKENSIVETTEITFPTNISNENDVPVSKLVLPQIVGETVKKVSDTKLFDEELKKSIEIEVASVAKPLTMIIDKENGETEESPLEIEPPLKVQPKYEEIPKSATEKSIPSRSSSEIPENHPFTINEDSFFNDDLDNDPSDKINDIVNNIINSSEFQIDSDNDKSEILSNENEVDDSSQVQPSCDVCKKTFRNEKVYQKHCTTSTHAMKVQRKSRGRTKEKTEMIVEKIQEKQAILSADETKVFRTKGALKIFDHILDIPVSKHQEKKLSVETNELKLDISQTEKMLNANDDKLYYEFKMEKKPEDMTPKDKDQLFDSLFNSLEAKVDDKSVLYEPKPSESLCTPQDSEIETTSSASWDLKPENDIDWEGDNTDNVTFATAIKERYPKKFPVKINKLKDTAVSIPTKSLIMGKIFKKHRDREKQKIPQADAPNNKPGIKNSLDEIFDHLKNSADIDDKVLTCPSPKTLLKSVGGSFANNSSNTKDMLETASQSNINNNIVFKKTSEKEVRKVKENIKAKPPVTIDTANEIVADGTGQRKSRRRCAIKAKTFAETWSSDEYEELHDTEDIISIINEIEKRESVRKKKMLKAESNFLMNKDLDDAVAESYTEYDDYAVKTNTRSEAVVETDSLHEQENSSTEKKKSVQVQLVGEKMSSSIKKRRPSLIKDGHKSDEERFTATKDFKPTKPGLSIKKRRMSCFVPSTTSFDERGKVKSTDVKSVKEPRRDETEIYKKANENLDLKAKPTIVKKSDSEKSFKNTKKLSSLINSSNIQQLAKKKLQKHRKRPRNKVKNIAYDSDSDFELNLNKKSKALTANGESSSSAEDEEGENETVTIAPKSIKSPLLSTSSKINSSHDMTVMKEPKLLPNDLKHIVLATSTFKAAIPEDIYDPSQTTCNRTKRQSSEKLYYWSSSSSESEQEQGDTADGDNEDSVIPHQPEQHGWIVGDSHKKLVTLLAHAKIKNKIN